MFEIGGYKPGRQLKGFTRPVNRIVKKMRDNGEIGEDAIDPFTPVYPVGTGYAQAQKFRVPACIVALWTE